MSRTRGIMLSSKFFSARYSANFVSTFIEISCQASREISKRRLIRHDLGFVQEVFVLQKILVHSKKKGRYCRNINSRLFNEMCKGPIIGRNDKMELGIFD